MDEMFSKLRGYARIIRDEKATSANTALRIGDMYLSIIDAMEEQGEANVEGIAEAKELTEAETDRAKGVEEGLTKIVAQHQGDINGMKPQIQSLTKGVLDNANSIDAVREYIDKLFTLDEATETIKTKYNFSSEKSIATKGVGSSSGGGGNSYGRLDNWANYDASKGDVLSALLGYGLKNDIATLTSKFGNYFTKNETRNEIVAYLHDFNDEMIVPNYSTKSEVGSLADVVGGIGSRVSTLEGKATAVSFAQTLQSGKQIGVISIDGKNTTLFAPAGYAWGEITSRPTKLSDFTDDVVSGKYLPFSGGAIIGTSASLLTLDRTDGNPYIQFNHNGGYVGRYGFNKDTYVPIVYLVDGTSQTVLHTSNYSKYALPLSGGTITGTLNVGNNISADGTGSFALGITAGSTSKLSLIHVGSIEMNVDGKFTTNGGFIDFHYGGSQDDYTSRIIENERGRISIYADTGVDVTGPIRIGGKPVIHSGNIGDQIVLGSYGIKSSTTESAGSISYYRALGVSETLAAAPSWCKPVGVDTDGNTMILRMRWSIGSYGHDIYAGPNTYDLYHRNTKDATNVWRKLLDSVNFSDYALPLSGGNLNTDANITFRSYNGIASPEYGWAMDFIKFASRDGNNVYAKIGAFGKGDSYYYTYIGCNEYNGLNLRVWENNITWGDNDIIHSGNYSDYALPLYGGTISNRLIISSYSDAKLILNETGSDSKYQYIEFQNGGVKYGLLGTFGDDNLKWNSQIIIHSGNIGSQNVESANRLRCIMNIPSSGFDANTSLVGGGYIPNYSLTSRWGSTMPSGMSYGVVYQLQGYMTGESLAGQLAWDVNHKGADSTNRLWWRANDDTGFVNAKWHQIAFTDSNVASADKLSDNAAYTAWGQTFFENGKPKSVSGHLSLGYNSILGAAGENALELSQNVLAVGYGYRNLALALYGNLVHFYRGGVESLRINSSGNVTIGSGDLAGDSYKLYVNGNSIYRDVILADRYNGQGNTSGASLIINKGGKYFGIGASNQNTTILSMGLCSDTKGTWDTEVISIIENGNVGIGVKYPKYKLHVDGTFNASGDVTVGGKLKVGGILIEDKDGDLFINGNLAASGSVATKGIGTSSSGGSGTIPWSALENSLIAASTSYNLGSSAKPWGSVYANSGVLGTLVSSQSGVTLTSYVMGQGNTWQISANGSASFASLTVGGTNVGNSISYDVGYVQSGNNGLVTGNSVYVAITSYDSDVLANKYAKLDNTYTKTQVNNNFAAKSEAEIVYSVSVTGDRNVAPSLNLDCGNGVWSLRNAYNGTNGDLKFLFDEQQRAQLTPAGDLTISGRLTQSSDETLKNILGYNVDMKVRDIANAPICYFTWKDRVSDRQIGTIAQYWRLITPECVVEEEGRMSMDYSTLGLVSSIVNAREIVKHEDEIEALKKRVKELEDKLAALKAA